MEVTDWPRALLSFLIALWGWLTSGLLETAEMHAEPYVAARWTIHTKEKSWTN